TPSLALGRDDNRIGKRIGLIGGDRRNMVLLHAGCGNDIENSSLQLCLHRHSEFDTLYMMHTSQPNGPKKRAPTLISIMLRTSISPCRDDCNVQHPLLPADFLLSLREPILLWASLVELHCVHSNSVNVTGGVGCWEKIVESVPATCPRWGFAPTPAEA